MHIYTHLIIHFFLNSTLEQAKNSVDFFLCKYNNFVNRKKQLKKTRFFQYDLSACISLGKNIQTPTQP